MRFLSSSTLVLGFLGQICLTRAHSNFSRVDLRSEFSIFDDRPPGCPSCFNCLNPSDTCRQFATCNKFNGKCSCPPGFGGDDCSQPLCGALPDGDQREPRRSDEDTCECKQGWGGINCNLCKTNDACNAMMPENDEGIQEGGVCYKGHAAVKENYQMCAVTNEQILGMLPDRKPEVTFSCEASNSTCNFQCKAFTPSHYVLTLTSLQSGSISENLSTVLWTPAVGTTNTPRLKMSLLISATT